MRVVLFWSFIAAIIQLRRVTAWSNTSQPTLRTDLVPTSDHSTLSLFAPLRSNGSSATMVAYGDTTVFHEDSISSNSPGRGTLHVVDASASLVVDTEPGA